MHDVPKALLIIAGRGVYPRLLAEAARRQGVERLVAIGFRRETNPLLADLVDEMIWVRLGQLDTFLSSIQRCHISDAVMVGQITPTHLFSLRFDRAMRNFLKNLHPRNAMTIFGGLCNKLEALGLRLRRASLFMEDAMPLPGRLSLRAPDEREWEDIALGMHVAKVSSGLEIGQTVIVKEGTILAVEAFEGTDLAIQRAGRLGGPGAVVVKTAKQGHDMRYDIPVIGQHTMKWLAKAKVSALALEAQRTIILEQEQVLVTANRLGLAVVAVQGDAPDGEQPLVDTKKGSS